MDSIYLNGWAGQGKPLGGTLQDPFIYLNNRIFKYSYRIYYTLSTWHDASTYTHILHITCIYIYIFNNIYIYIYNINDWKLYVRIYIYVIYIYSRRTLYVCCLLLGPPAIQINYGPPLFFGTGSDRRQPRLWMDGKNTESRGTTKGADRKTAARLQGDWGDNTTGNDHRPGDGLSIFLVCNCQLYLFGCIVFNVSRCGYMIFIYDVWYNMKLVGSPACSHNTIPTNQ